MVRSRRLRGPGGGLARPAQTSSSGGLPRAYLRERPAARAAPSRGRDEGTATSSCKAPAWILGGGTVARGHRRSTAAAAPGGRRSERGAGIWTVTLVAWPARRQAMFTVLKVTRGVLPNARRCSSASHPSSDARQRARLRAAQPHLREQLPPRVHIVPAVSPQGAAARGVGAPHREHREALPAYGAGRTRRERAGAASPAPGPWRHRPLREARRAAARNEREEVENASMLAPSRRRRRAPRACGSSSTARSTTPGVGPAVYRAWAVWS